MELYARLPSGPGKRPRSTARCRPGGAVLDLGCGTGRLAEPLARLGHPVTGVDNEPAMLARLRASTGICADLATLHPRATFPAVLLMSHFVNDADAGFVDSTLAAARRHVAGSDVLVVERYPPGRVPGCRGSVRESAGVRFGRTVLDRTAGVLTATVRYELDGLAAVRRFRARDLDDAGLAALTARAGLRLAGCLDPATTLAVPRPA